MGSEIEKGKQAHSRHISIRAAARRALAGRMWQYETKHPLSSPGCIQHTTSRVERDGSLTINRRSMCHVPMRAGPLWIV